MNLSNTVTAGVVSCKRGAIELGIENDINYIQTDAAITVTTTRKPFNNLSLLIFIRCIQEVRMKHFFSLETLEGP